MGVVFSARHAVIERPLAIKVLKREVMRDTATIQRFVQEAKAASRIGHPNIVDVTDFGTTPDGMTYSVMEFVDGADARRRAARRRRRSRRSARSRSPRRSRARSAPRTTRASSTAISSPRTCSCSIATAGTDFVKIVDFGIAKVAPVDGAAPTSRG